jgi:hypothetical protein
MKQVSKCCKLCFKYKDNSCYDETCNCHQPFEVAEEENLKHNLKIIEKILTPKDSIDNDTEKELLKLLNDPRTGLKDSSDTNKTRYSILALFSKDFIKENLINEYLCRKCKRTSKIIKLKENCPFCENSIDNDWEKEFDERFPAEILRYPNPSGKIQDQEYIESICHAVPRKNIKHFISTILSKNSAKERELIRETIELMPKPTRLDEIKPFIGAVLSIFNKQ